MATTNNTSYTESQIQGAPFGINQTFQSILSEYQDPQWFKNMIFDPFKYIPGGWKAPMAKAGYRDPDRLWSSTLGQFSEFSTTEWETADYVTGIARDNLDAQLNLSLEQSEEEKLLDERIYEEKRDKKINEAEAQMQNTLVNQDTSKALIRQQALNSISQIDSLIAHSGIKSGSYDKKKSIALDTVQTDLEKANLTKAMSVRDYNLAKVAADREYDFNIEKSNLKHDQQYETSFLNKEHKQENLDLKLVEDKIDIYEQWKANQVESAATILASEEHLYGSEADRIEAFKSGGAEYDIMKEQYIDFTENWDNWKEENSELYEDMLTNPEEYGIETYTRSWRESTRRFAPYIEFDVDDLSLDFETHQGTIGGWDYFDATPQELEASIMNQIFLTGQGGDWTREEYGEWSPWMALKRGGDADEEGVPGQWGSGTVEGPFGISVEIPGGGTPSTFIGQEWDFLLSDIEDI